MGLLSKIKKNKVALNFENYCILLRGEPKSGKSTLYSEIVNEFYGTPDAGLLIPFEKGYSAIDNVNIFPYTVLPEMKIDGVTKHGWDVFVELIDEIIATKDENGIKIVCIDTVDEVMRVATSKIMKLSVKETGKPCKSLNDAFGGFARGKERLGTLIKDQIQKIRNAGIGIIFIGHTKYKTLKTKIDQEEYQILGSNLSEDLDRMIANDADMIIMITNEAKIVKGEIVGHERKIRLRSDGFYAAGSRFKHVPETIECDAKTFIKTMEEAVKAAAHISNDKDFEIAKSEEIKEQAKEIKENAPDPEEKAKIIKAMQEKTKTMDSVEKKAFITFVTDNDIKLKDPEANDIEILKMLVDKYELVY